MIFSWYAYDRVPIISTYDEAILNDPALSVSLGLGLRAPHLAGIELATIFAHFPPVYIFLQAATFRLAGFSALTLRFWPVTLGALDSVIVVFMLDLLWRRQVLTGVSAVIGGVIAIVDLPLLWSSRLGRLDSTVVFLGLSAALAVVSAKPGHDGALPRWLSAATLVGLALATHPAAVYYYWVYFVFVCVFFKHFGWRRSVLLLFLPGVVAAGIWTATYGAHSIEAIRQFRMIMEHRLDLNWGLGFGQWWALLIAGRWIEILRAGLSWGTVVVSLSIPAIALLSSAGADCRSRIAACIAAGVWVIAWKITGLYVTRVVLVFPIAVFLLATSISALRGIGLAAKAAAAFVSAVLLIETIALGSYLARGSGHDPGRAPTRFETLEFSPSATIAAVPQLWFHFALTGRPFRMILDGFPLDTDYWTEKPSRFDAYDIVIIEEGSSLLRLPSLRNRKISRFRDSAFEYWICQRQPVSAATAGQRQEPALMAVSSTPQYSRRR